jgi:signal peptidase I
VAPSREGWREGARLSLGAVGTFVLTGMLWLALWALAPAAIGMQPVTVVSGSMSPAVRTGDVVHVGPPSGELSPGNVVVFRDHDDQLVTHRITEVLDDGTYRTKGDANRSVDSSPLRSEQVVGVGRVLVPYAGLPRFWLNEGQLGLVVGWFATTLAALAATRFLRAPGAGVPLPVVGAGPDGVVRSGRPRREDLGQRRTRPRRVRGRRQLIGVGTALVVVGPIALVTAVAAFTGATAGYAEFLTGEWSTTRVYTASEDGSVRKLDREGRLLWRLGEQVVLADDMEDFEDWGTVGSGGVEQTDTVSRSGTYSLLKTGTDPGGGATKFGRTVGNGWRLEAWTGRPSGGGAIRFGVEDQHGDGYSLSLDHTDGLAIDRRDGGVPTELDRLVLGTPAVFPYRAVLERDGADLTFTLFDAGGAEVAQVTAADAAHQAFDRFVVRGAGGFYVDDVTVWDISHGIEGAQRAVAVGPDGDVYAAGADRVIRSFDAAGAPGWSFGGHTGTINAVATDQDGHVYSGADDGTVRKLDATGTQLWSVAHGQPVLTVAVDADGSVHLGDAMGTTRKLDAEGEPVWSVTDHAGPVLSVAVDAGGNVYTGGHDGDVHKRDRNGEPLWTFDGHGAAVAAVAIGPDGELHTASSDGSVRKLDLGGNQLWSFTGHDGPVRAVTVDDEGELFTAGDDGTARRVGPTGAEERWSFDGHEGPALAIDADPGRFGAAGHGPRQDPAVPTGVVATGTGSYSLGVSWDPVPVGEGAGWFEVRYRVDGATTWTSTSRTHVPEIGLTGLSSDTTYEVQVRAANELFTSDWSPIVTGDTLAGPVVYSTSADATGRSITSLGGEAWSFGASGLVDVDADVAGDVYFASTSGSLHKRDANNGEVWSVSVGSAIRVVTTDADGHVYVGSDDGRVRKLASADGTQVWQSSAHGSGIRAVTVDTDGNVYTGTEDGTVRRLAADGAQVWSFAGHSAAVRGLAVAPTGDVYTASSDTTVRRLDRGGVQVWSFGGHTGVVNAVALDADGRLFTASSDGTVREVDATGGTQVWSSTVHTGAVRGVAVDTGGYVISGGSDDTVRRLRRSDGGQVWSFGGHTDDVLGVTSYPGRYTAAGHDPRRVPDEVTGLVGSDPTTATLEVTWEPQAAGSGASWYEIRHRTLGDETWGAVQKVYGTATTLASLVGDTTYEFQVRGRNDLKTGEWSTATATTLPGPAPATNLVATAGCPASPITHVGSTTAGVPTDGGTMALAVPSDAVEGDLLLMSLGWRDKDYSLATPPSAAAWTFVGTRGEGGAHSSIYYRYASASEPASYTIGFAREGAGGISAYRGVSPTAPIDAWLANGGHSQEMTAPAITTTAPGALLVTSYTTTAGAEHPPPPDMIRRFQASSGTGKDRPRVSSHSELRPSAGSTGTRQTTYGGSVVDRWVAHSVALRAATPLTVELTWDATPTLTAEGYEVERWTGGVLDASWSVTGRLPGAFTDTTVLPGVAYDYRLRAVEGPYVSADITTSLPAQPPC